jgi:lipopolysaccharide heptosyltransferase II
MEKALSRILVVRTDRIGDVLLSTPVVEALRLKYPGAHIAMLVSKGAKDVVEGNPFLNEVLVDEGERASWLAERLKAKRLDTAIVLHPTPRLAWALSRAKIPMRVGTGYRGFSFLFTKRVYEHRKKAVRHELEYNLSLAEALGAGLKNPEPKIFLSSEDKAWARERLNKAGIKEGEKLVGIHPGSGGTARDWKPERFGELGERIQKELGVRVIVTGVKEERELAEVVASKMSKPPIMIVGETNLKQLTAILERESVFVSNSTGPMHLAAAVGTRVVAMFPPITACSPRRWGPWGKGHKVILPKVPECRKCTEAKCKVYDCMDRIKVDEVFTAVKGALGK